MCVSQCFETMIIAAQTSKKRHLKSIYQEMNDVGSMSRSL